MTFTNNLDPDEAPQNTGPHQRSKLFDTQINILDGNNSIMDTCILKERRRKKYLVMQSDREEMEKAIFIHFNRVQTGLTKRFSCLLSHFSTKPYDVTLIEIVSDPH